MKKSQGAVRFPRPTGRSEAGRDVKTKRMMDDAALQRPTRCASYARLISHSQALRLEPRVEKEKKDGICGAYQTGQDAERTHVKQGVVDTG